jgi:peroxiredoxin
MTARRSLIALGVLAVLLAAGAAQALEVGEKAPERAYFIIDREGIVRYKKIRPNALDLLKPEEVLQAFKDSGAK